MQQASKALSAPQTCCAYVCAAGFLLEKDQGVHLRRSHCCSPHAVRVAPGPPWLPPIWTQLQFAPPCTRKKSLCQAMVAHKCLRVGACSLRHQGRTTLRVLNPCFKIHCFQEAAACKIAASDFMQTRLPCLKGPHPLCRMTISCVYTNEDKQGAACTKHPKKSPQKPCLGLQRLLHGSQLVTGCAYVQGLT